MHVSAGMPKSRFLSSSLLPAMWAGPDAASLSERLSPSVRRSWSCLSRNRGLEKNKCVCVMMPVQERLFRQRRKRASFADLMRLLCCAGPQHVPKACYMTFVVDVDDRASSSVALEYTNLWEEHLRAFNAAALHTNDAVPLSSFFVRASRQQALGSAGELALGSCIRPLGDERREVGSVTSEVSFRNERSGRRFGRILALYWCRVGTVVVLHGYDRVSSILMRCCCCAGAPLPVQCEHSTRLQYLYCASVVPLRPRCSTTAAHP